MKCYLKYIFLGCIISFINITECYKKFVILIASYNNEKWAEQNIVSAFQNYPEDYYRIIFIDDCSTDKTLEVVTKTVKKHKKERLVTIIHNEKRAGCPLFNHWRSIHNLIADEEIVVILDGDDLLVDDRVLEFLNNIYTKYDVWLTYGQYQEIHSGAIGFNKQMPAFIVKKNNFRKWQDIPSHLRTFYAKLYKNIKVDDLMLDGKFLDMAGDLATMIPMIEMARDHFRFIPKVLYLYNDQNPLSEHRVSAKRQKDVDLYVRSLPVYQPLERLF